jgi:exodeoxyribonuclease VII small subunit
MKEKKMSYDSAYAELQQIVTALQQNEISIDHLAEKVQRANELVAFCQTKLREVESSIQNQSK